jgi:hypothetical protein
MDGTGSRSFPVEGFGSSAVATPVPLPQSAICSDDSRNVIFEN